MFFQTSIETRQVGDIPWPYALLNYKTRFPLMLEAVVQAPPHSTRIAMRVEVRLAAQASNIPGKARQDEVTFGRRGIGNIRLQRCSCEITKDQGQLYAKLPLL